LANLYAAITPERAVSAYNIEFLEVMLPISFSNLKGITRIK